MTDPRIERRLREAGGEFIESHRRAEEAIDAAVQAGMSHAAIGQVSGLSRETVDAFVRSLAKAPNPGR